MREGTRTSVEINNKKKKNSVKSRKREVEGEESESEVYIRYELHECNTVITFELKDFKR